MKVLIVTHAYAPDRNPRAYRWSAIAEHWAASSDHVDVLTTGRGGGAGKDLVNGVTVHRVGERAIGRLRRSVAREGPRSNARPASGASRARAIARVAYDAFWKSVYWPDYACTWYGAARRKALRLCEETHYDSVISVSHPFTGHLIGQAVKKRFPEIRWIADTGDPFSLDGIVPQNNARLYRRLNRLADARVLRWCDVMTVTVAGLKDALDRTHPEASRKTVVVPPLLSLPDGAAEPEYVFDERDACNLVYLGRLYGALRGPEALLALFAALRRRSPRLRLHLFGDIEDCESALAACGADLRGSITFHEPAPRERVPAIMAAADVLVNIGNDSATQLPSKVVEYAWSGKPILNIARRDDDTARFFLENYPAALTVICKDARPTEEQVARCLAFVERPPRAAPETVEAFIADYRIGPVAARYAGLARGSEPARRPIRVLIDAIHAKAGGGVTYLRHLLPLLAEDPRLDLHLLLHADQVEPLGPFDRRIIVHAERFRSTFAMRLLWEQLALPFRARAIGAEVTFCLANYGPLLAPRPVLLLGNTIEAGVSETRPLMKVYWDVLRVMTALSLRRCAAAIAVSAYARDSLANGRTARKVRVVHHGVGAAYTPNPDPERRTGEGFLLAVGTIYPHKNFDTLIRAMKRVRERVPGAMLKIAGGAPPGGEGVLEALRRTVADCDLDGAVSFLGPQRQNDLIALYRECAAFVFPSTAESFGLPLLEAMACGAPVVCSNSAAMPEIVGGAACLFDPRDADDIADKLAAVLMNPEQAAILSRKGVERARRFSWSDAARATADVLVSAAPGKASARPRGKPTCRQYEQGP